MAFVNKNGPIMTSDGIPYMYAPGTVDADDITFLYARSETPAADIDIQSGPLLAWGNGRIFRSASEFSSFQGKVFGYHPKINDYTPVEYTASDAANSDYFGFSIDAGFGRVAIGAPGDDSPTSGGAVYVYDYEGTSSQIKIRPSDVGTSDNFGRSVQIMNNKLYALSYTGQDTDNSELYKFNLDGTGQQKTVVYNLGDATTMAAANGLIAVSDWGENVGAKLFAGRVQIFDENLSFIKELLPTGGDLTPDGGSSVDPAFGHAMAIGSGRIIINGEIFDTVTGTRGKVHIYNYKFQRLKTLKGIDYVDIGTAKFGQSVDVGFGYIAVGAPGYDGAGSSRQGAVFVFDLDGNLITRIDPEINKSYDQRFGQSVALGPGRLAILSDLERRTEVYKLPQRFTPFDVAEMHRGKA